MRNQRAAGQFAWERAEKCTDGKHRALFAAVDARNVFAPTDAVAASNSLDGTGFGQAVRHAHARSARLLVTLFAFALALFAVITVAPRVAFAEDYSMPQVNIDATVGTDGSLHVVEERTFAFSGGYSSARFSLDLPYDGTLVVNGVWMGDPDDIDQNGNVISTPLRNVTFDQDWREGGGPSVSSYAVDKPRDTIYVYFNSADEACTITLDYTVEDALGVYRDVGELYWTYVASNWDTDSQNVTLNVHIPVPTDTVATPGEDVLAWGHGPQDGAVAINADGSVTCTCPTVRAGQYAAVRLVFPSPWLVDVPIEVRQKHQTVAILDDVIQEEEGWTDVASEQQGNWLSAKAGLAGFSILLLLAVFVLWACIGKEHRPRGKGGFEPEKLDSWMDMHPAVAGRLWRFDRESASDVTAAVLRLAAEGYVSIQRDAVPQGDDAKPGHYVLVCTRSACASGSPDAAEGFAPALSAEEPNAPKNAFSALDRATLDLLFARCGDGAHALPFSAIVRAAEEHPHEFLSWLNDWQKVLSENVQAQGLFEKKGWRLQIPVMVLGAVWALAGFACWYFLHDASYAAIMAPTGLLLMLCGAHMPRRSQAGAELNAKCETLRAWLKERAGGESDTPVDDTMPRGASEGDRSENDELRGNLAIYAYVLGVASPEGADALTSALDEGWKVARDALRAHVRSR